MLKHGIILILFVLLILSAGCVKSPQEASQETRIVFENASSTIQGYLPQEDYVPSTFAPLTTSDAYPVKTYTPKAAETSTAYERDVIVGTWRPAQYSTYMCRYYFSEDERGYTSCDAAGVRVQSEKFSWEYVGISSNQSFMRNYNITPIHQDLKSRIQISTRTGWMYAPNEPAYLIKES